MYARRDVVHSLADVDEWAQPQLRPEKMNGMSILCVHMCRPLGIGPCRLRTKFLRPLPRTSESCRRAGSTRAHDAICSWRQCRPSMLVGQSFHDAISIMLPPHARCCVFLYEGCCIVPGTRVFLHSPFTLGSLTRFEDQSALFLLAHSS